jgi:phytoene synthase
MAHAAAPAKGQSVDFQVARQICRRHHSDFYSATVFLTKPKRDAVCAAFAFCRILREAFAEADLPQSTSSCCSSGSTLPTLLEMIDAIYDGKLQLPLPAFRDEGQHVLAAFAATVDQFDIPQEFLVEAAHGYADDAATARYATWRSLERSLRRSAGSVARVVASVLGMRHTDAADRAAELGMAVRFTNILSDLKRDWSRGRLLLPLEDLVRFRCRERDLAAGVVDGRFDDLMEFEIARARELYRRAADGICWLADDGSRLMAASVVAVQARLLDAIERRRYDVFTNHPRLTMPQKLRCLPMAMRLARRESDRPLPEIFR